MRAPTRPTSVPDLAAEICEAIADLDAGNYLALSPEQLENWVASGELEVLDEWLDESPSGERWPALPPDAVSS